VHLLPELQSTAINIFIALLCGALIGTERQARKRTAGLRTNALVAIGAAAFVIFAARFPGEASPTRVAAQVVSGIGFLGAGIIFRDGFNVHGLNTAATLWCSAAVGLMAGTGAWHLALLLTGFVVFVNVGLRPVVKWLKRKTAAEDLTQREYHVWVRCRGEHEAQTRAHILKAFANGTLAIISISALPTETAGVVELETIVAGTVAAHNGIDDPIRELVQDPHHLQVRWQQNEEN
jgi:putative Mg2+ transporter-C (MgtC) family protein